MSEIKKSLTLRKQVQNVLKKEILEKHRAGEYLPGERILAKRFGVSILTIREAVQGLVDLRMVERRQGLGTVVLSRSEAMADCPIGILVEIDVTHPNTSPFYLTLAMQLKGELESQGHKARLFLGNLVPGEISEEPACEEFNRAADEGTLKAVVALSATSLAWRKKFESQKIPVVCLGNNSTWGVNLNKADFLRGALTALQAQGCERIALMTWDGQRSKCARERSEYFRELLGQAGLQTHAQWIVAGVQPALNGAGWEAMRDIWSAENERPDGLIVTDDMLLRGALVAIRELRVQIPQQLKIAALAMPGQMHVGMTPIVTYAPPIEEIVHALAGLVAERLENFDLPGKIISLSPQLLEAEVLPEPSEKEGSVLVLAGNASEEA